MPAKTLTFMRISIQLRRYVRAQKALRFSS